MNNYPAWWDTTITIYNKFTDPQTNVVTWYRTVIDNCFWKYVGDKIKIGEVVLETDNTICRIPKNSSFLRKYEWEALSNYEMSNYFTLGIGDIIVDGAVDDVINEYVKGQRSNDLITKYKARQGCIRIDAVSINVGAGRGNEHYLIRGT